MGTWDRLERCILYKQELTVRLFSVCRWQPLVWYFFLTVWYWIFQCAFVAFLFPAPGFLMFSASSVYILVRDQHPLPAGYGFSSGA